MRRVESTRPILLVCAAVLCAALVGCGGSGTVETSGQSETRDSAGPSVAPDPPGDVAAYCETASEVRGALEELEVDPGAVLDGLGELAELAPEGLREEFRTAIDALGQLEGLDEDDPSSFSKVLEVLLDPELLDALGAIDAFTFEECGFNLDPSSDDGPS